MRAVHGRRSLCLVRDVHYEHGFVNAVRASVHSDRVKAVRAQRSQYGGRNERPARTAFTLRK
eukprot:3223015-Prymnesium_polylepis.1